MKKIPLFLFILLLAAHAVAAPDDDIAVRNITPPPTTLITPAPQPVADIVPEAVTPKIETASEKPPVQTLVAITPEPAVVEKPAEPTAKPDVPWANYVTDGSVPTVKADTAAVKQKPAKQKQTEKTKKAKKQTAALPALEEQFATARAPQPAAPAPIFTPPAEVEKVQPYLPAGALSPELLPAPPVEKSAAHKKQIARVIEAQRAVTSNDITAIVDEHYMEISHITSAIDGFDIDTHPATRHLLERVFATSKASTRAAKKFWNTRRPYLTDKRVKLMVDRIDDSPAYPSGHTAAARLLAEVMGLLIPDKRAVLRAQADAVAWHRVQAGVHYPVDLEGGRFLAGMMLGSLLTNTDFQRDLSAAAIELSVTPSQIAN